MTEVTERLRSSRLAEGAVYWLSIVGIYVLEGTSGTTPSRRRSLTTA
jgi:hypothetical protein